MVIVFNYNHHLNGFPDGVTACSEGKTIDIERLFFIKFFFFLLFIRFVHNLYERELCRFKRMSWNAPDIWELVESLQLQLSGLYIILRALLVKTLMKMNKNIDRKSVV